MSKKSKAAVAALVVVLLVLAGAMVARQREASRLQAEQAARVQAERAETPVEFGAADTLVLAPQELARAIPITGSLRPANQTVVRSKIAGEIRELTVREGIAVRQGQRIGRIDPTEFEQRLREREAQLASADAQLAQARRDLQQNRALTERGFISQSAYERSQSQLDVADANRRAAEAGAAVARKTLSDAVLVAPMSGVVAERFAQVGEKVSPDARIVSIVDLSRMEIEAPVPAESVGRVAVGQSVELSIEGIDARQVGRIARIAPSTQANSRSVPVYIALDNTDPRVRAGMFAQGLLSLERKAGVIALPYAAVRDRGGRSFVYAIEGGRIVERDVRLGLRDDAARAPSGATGLVEVVEGLKAGDRVVAINLGTLRAGAPARVAAAPQADAARAAAPQAVR